MHAASVVLLSTTSPSRSDHDLPSTMGTEPSLRRNALTNVGPSASLTRLPRIASAARRPSFLRAAVVRAFLAPLRLAADSSPGTGPPGSSATCDGTISGGGAGGSAGDLARLAPLLAA